MFFISFKSLFFHYCLFFKTIFSIFYEIMLIGASISEIERSKPSIIRTNKNPHRMKHAKNQWFLFCLVKLCLSILQFPEAIQVARGEAGDDKGHHLYICSVNILRMGWKLKKRSANAICSLWEKKIYFIQQFLFGITESFNECISSSILFNIWTFCVSNCVKNV